MSNCPEYFARFSIEMLDEAVAKIEHCVAQLNDSQIWWRPEPSMNSVGNLILHLCGNLRQWGIVPFTLARDRRDRAEEFASDVRVEREQLMQILEQTVAEAQRQWKHVNDDQLGLHVTIQGFDVTMMHAILHTTHHFVGHTHQIVQLTRLRLRNGYRFHWTPEEQRSNVPV